MASAPPLPNRPLAILAAAASALILGCLVLALTMPALRQRRLLEEARRVCIERQAEVQLWLERGPAVSEALEQEEAAARRRGERLMRTDDEVVVRGLLEQFAAARGLRVVDFRLGTPRYGEAFDTVPTSLQLLGDRAELPPFLQTFYEQTRVVRLVALDLETPEFGSQNVAVTLRWEYASPSRRKPEVGDPGTLWSPPGISQASGLGFGSMWNRTRWERLEESADALRALIPPARQLAGLEARRAMLEKERRSLARWEEASDAERKAVLRKLPILLSRLEVSAVGRAGLRPGPGGTLRIVDDD